MQATSDASFMQATSDSTLMPTTESLFLHLLRCGVRQEMPCEEMFRQGGVDWPALRAMAEKQAVTGLVFWAVRQLPKELQPPRREVYLPWLSAVEEISRRNEEMNALCRKVTERLAKAGFRSCILKGQGAAQMYDEPSLRIAGDIDVWLWPESVALGEQGSLSARRARIIEYVRFYRPQEEVVYHHMDFGVLRDVPMEVHFTPSWMNSPWRNRRLQRWFVRQAPRQFGGVGELGYGVPTMEFNAVYMLLHIFRHLFNEGIGLRQVVDYYYALRALEMKNDAVVLEALRMLGMMRFCGALMWVLRQLFGLDEAHMLVPAREREGRLLLEEILLAGNFGKTDTRFRHHANGTFGAFCTRTWRNLGFVRQYPSEVLWTPLWKIGQYVWRKRMGYL